MHYEKSSVNLDGVLGSMIDANRIVSKLDLGDGPLSPYVVPHVQTFEIEYRDAADTTVAKVEFDGKKALSVSLFSYKRNCEEDAVVELEDVKRLMDKMSEVVRLTNDTSADGPGVYISIDINHGTSIRRRDAKGINLVSVSIFTEYNENADIVSVVMEAHVYLALGPKWWCVQDKVG